MRIAIVLAALLAALAVAVGILLQRGDEADFRGSRPPEGLTPPTFALHDDEGRGGPPPTQWRPPGQVSLVWAPPPPASTGFSAATAPRAGSAISTARLRSC